MVRRSALERDFVVIDWYIGNGVHSRMVHGRMG